jgi:hypothetical protein
MACGASASGHAVSARMLAARGGFGPGMSMPAPPVRSRAGRKEARSKACLGRRAEGSACVGGHRWPGGAALPPMGRRRRPTRRPGAGGGAVRGVPVGSLAPPRAGAGDCRPRRGSVKRLPGCGGTGKRSGDARSAAHDPDDGPRRRSCPLPARTNQTSVDPHAAGDAG